MLQGLNSNSKFITYLASGVRPSKLSTTLAIAKVLADTALLSSSDVENPENAYDVMCSGSVGKNLSDLNEVVVVDVENILNYTKKFWLVRLGNAYPPKRIFSPTAITCPLAAFNIYQNLSRSDLDAISDNFLEFSEIYNSLRELIV